MQRRNTKLILSLDVIKKKDFLYWVSLTQDFIDYYKIGIIPFVSLGPQSIKILKKKDKKVFLDLKFFDIPNTMFKSSIQAIKWGVDILDFHLLHNENNLKECIKMIREYASTKKISLPVFLGVTVLTSIKPTLKILASVLKLSKKACNIGLDGVVCSGRESPFVRKEIGENFIIVSPGIRLDSANDDQKRVCLPQDVKGIVDFIIVGRPILNSKEPLVVIKKILKQLR